MYDTVNFWIDRVNISGGDPFEVLPCLSEITERNSDKKGYSCTGKAGDYTVTVLEKGIFLQGSLAKYFLPTNIHTLTRSATQQAIEKLSDHLHTDINIAKIIRVDVSTIIPTKLPPANYYAYLGSKVHFNRKQLTNGTLYYNTCQKRLVFYDKADESSAKGTEIPAILAGSNLLRYELRFLNRINRQFKMDVTGKTLYDEDFYYSIIKQWRNEFEKIQKLKSDNFMTDDITTLKVAKEALFAHLLQKEGQSIIDEFLNELKAANKFNSRSDYTKLKADLNRLIVSKNGNKSELIKELETAIYNASNYAR